MMVYVLTGIVELDTIKQIDNIGVFRTQEKAENFLEQFKEYSATAWMYDEFSIETHTLDEEMG